MARADATAFVGGWVGLPGREVLVVPEDWLNALPESTRHIALLRRRGALETGGRALGVSVAAAWTLLGLAIVAWTTGADLSQPGGSLYQIEHSNGGLVTFPGGLPIRCRDGKIIGAIGVSGDTVENEHIVADAGAAAAHEA